MQQNQSGTPTLESQPVTKVPSGDFSTKGLTVTPPTPVPLPSSGPTCGFSGSTQGHFLGDVQAHYEIYGQNGTQQNTTNMQTARSDLRLVVDPQGGLDVTVNFSTRGPSSFLGDFHNFGGRILVPPHSADEDFTYTSSASGNYYFLISRTSFSVTYSFVVPQVDMTVNYVAATRAITVTVNGSSNTVTAGTRSAYNISGGLATFTGTATFGLPACNVPPTIDLLVDPGTIVGSGDGTIPGASVGVAVNKKTTPWKLDVTAPEGSICAQPQQSGTDNTHLVFPFDTSTLGNGVYQLKAGYPTIPGVSDEASITVNLPVAVTPDKPEFNPNNGEEVTFDVKAPPCPQWTLKLEGEGVTEDGDTLTCTKEFTGTGDQPITWDGTCDGGAKAVGEWGATLTSGHETAHATVTAIAPSDLEFNVQTFSSRELAGTPSSPLNTEELFFEGKSLYELDALDFSIQAQSGSKGPKLGPDKRKDVYLDQVFTFPNCEQVPVYSRHWVDKKDIKQVKRTLAKTGQTSIHGIAHIIIKNKKTGKIAARFPAYNFELNDSNVDATGKPTPWNYVHTNIWYGRQITAPQGPGGDTTEGPLAEDGVYQIVVDTKRSNAKIKLVELGDITVKFKIQGYPGPYAHLAKDHPNYKPEVGGAFKNEKLRNAIFDENRRRNGGVLRDDDTGELLVEGTRGGNDEMAANIDHIIPEKLDPCWGQAGTNGYDNAKVISFRRNRAKSNYPQ